MFKAFFIGALWGTRTLGLLVRSQSLYPAELTTRLRFDRKGYNTINKGVCQQKL